MKKKISHTYDLHQLLQQKKFSDFFNASAFDDMLLKAANDAVVSFKNNNKWLARHPVEALVFMDLDHIWLNLKTVYAGDFKNLVYGDLPKAEAVLGTLNRIKGRLAKVI